jgi:transposase
VLLLRGIAKGEPTARLARELELSRKQVHTLRHRVQANLNATAPTEVMRGTAFEADELYQNAGEKNTPHRDPRDPPRRRAHKRKGHGTYADDRPPIISVVSRETGEHRFWVCDYADRRTCHDLIVVNVPAGGTRLYTDEWPRDRGRHPSHATVRHGVHEWARDDDRGALQHLRGSRGSTLDVSAGFPGCAQAVSASLCRHLRGRGQRETYHRRSDPAYVCLSINAH